MFRTNGTTLIAPIHTWYGVIMVAWQRAKKQLKRFRCLSGNWIPNAGQIVKALIEQKVFVKGLAHCVGVPVAQWLEYPTDATATWNLFISSFITCYFNIVSYSGNVTERHPLCGIKHLKKKITSFCDLFLLFAKKQWSRKKRTMEQQFKLLYVFVKSGYLQLI